MKKINKVVALFLAMVLAFGSFSISAFAAETEGESSIPEYATKHTIELTVDSGEELDASTWIWGEDTYTSPVNAVTYTPNFVVPDRYFGFEFSGTDTSGNAVSGTYEVSLLFWETLSRVASSTATANGLTKKVDNIDLSDTNYKYLFRINNYTGVTLSVTITYYSWA